ncbi:MAG: DEAD/DEAH box helicase [Anaerolineaceae bacterium]
MINQSQTNLDQILSRWKQDRDMLENIASWNSVNTRLADISAFPADLDGRLVSVLKSNRINGLYSHQAECWQAVLEKKNIVIVTGTASGKSLCYNLPVINSLINDPANRALYLFPTKALTQDQYNNVAFILRQINQNEITRHTGWKDRSAAVYDGDTPVADRPKIRVSANIIHTNPDMLHTSILPHHTIWEEFFSNLKYVVIDEIHTYRGVFGSHFANILRRLNRVTQFYGSSPQFILTSATIANPMEHAGALIEKPIQAITRDGSPAGKKNFILYNPPIMNRDLGIRKSASSEAVHLARTLLQGDVQTLLFCRARRTVELLFKNIQDQLSDINPNIRAYRGGFLPEHRREIEHDLRTGKSRLVVATNALELGIDIGGVEAVLMVGYPGSISATIQQSGRAGRGRQESLAILIASASPIDQYLMQHPEYLFENSAERAFINPNNSMILYHHLRAAAFELPFQPGERFGSLDIGTLQEYLAVLESSGDIHHQTERYYWIASGYPADQISIRNVSAKSILLQSSMESSLNGDSPGRKVTIGEVDETSAYWIVHPNAIYLHEGRTYLVDDLNIDTGHAYMREVDVDYFTEPLRKVEIEKMDVSRSRPTTGGEISYGEINVSTQVTGYRKTRWHTLEQLGDEKLEMPKTELLTNGYWMSLNEDIVEKLRESDQWLNDPGDYGPLWEQLRGLIRKRDHFTCQNCGLVEQGRSHHVHHRKPLKLFPSYVEANLPENLVTLCPVCHQKAEMNLRIRSGLSGLGFVLSHLAPIFLMCDISDLGYLSELDSKLADGRPAVLIYDQVPAGIGLANGLYDMHDDILREAHDLVRKCQCGSGCPSCVGPSGENALGSKNETLAILNLLVGEQI